MRGAVAAGSRQSEEPGVLMVAGGSDATGAGLDAVSAVERVPGGMLAAALDLRRSGHGVLLP